MQQGDRGNEGGRKVMELTMAEKRKFLEKTNELVKFGVLRKEDVDDIYGIYKNCWSINNYGGSISVSNVQVSNY